MIWRSITVFSFVIFFSLSGCSKKNVDAGQKYTFEEFKILSADSSMLPKKDEEGNVLVTFNDYSPGINLIESQGLKYKRLDYVAVSFATEVQARNEALRLNQYYARNWLFDHVEGEPILEDYVIETFKAINPNRKIQRIPKTHKSESESGAPAEHAGSEGHH